MGSNDQQLPPILPEEVVHYAWGMTLSSSSAGEPTTTPDDIRNSIKTTRNRLETQLAQREKERDEAKENLRKNSTDADLKNKLDEATAELKAAQVRQCYMINVDAALSSCERNLRSIINGRNLSYSQTDDLMKTQIANIESSQRLTANLQSALPRFFATGTGAGGVILVNYILEGLFNYTVPAEVLAAAAIVVAAAFYGGFELFVAPKNISKSQREIIKNCYRKNVYFANFMKRATIALESLFDEVLGIYHSVYGSDYGLYQQDNSLKKKVIANILGGQTGKDRCPRITQHYALEELKPELWCLCETGTYDDCPLYKKPPEQPKLNTKRVQTFDIPFRLQMIL